MTTYETYTLIAAFVAISITLTGVIWTGILTRKSNEIMEKDLIMRHRPWIIIDAPILERAKINSDTDFTRIVSADELLSISHDKLHTLGKTEFHWRLDVQNTGFTPAVNFTIHSLKRWDLEITIDELKKENSALPVSTNILFPQEKSRQSIQFDIQNWNEDIFKYFWAGFIVRYEFEDHLRKTQIVTIYKIWKFQTSGWQQIPSFSTQEQKKS